MKTRNSILQAAVASALLVMFGAANAGTLATTAIGGTVFAVEDFGTTTTATTGITPGVFTYTIGTTNGIVINANGVIYATVRLTNGKFATAPVVTGTVTTAPLSGSVGAGVLSADFTTVTYPITFAAGATLGVGSTLIFTPAALGINNVKTTLGTVGGSVSASVSLSAIAPVTTPDTGTAQAADVDAPIATAPIAVAAQAINATVASLTGANPVAGSKVQIDLSAVPVASSYVTTNAAGVPTQNVLLAALGSVTLTDATTAAYAFNGATAVTTATLLSGAGALVIDVTPDAGKSFPIGSSLSLSAAAACTGLFGTVGPLTATTAAAKVSLTASTELLTGAPYYVCLSAPSANNVATPVTPSITATATSAVATDKTTTITGTGYALGYNGSQVDVYNFVPAAQVGYTNYVRVINTGSSNADISVAKIDSATGAFGASGVLGNLAPGATRNFTPAEVDIALGTALDASERPRLRITAPTSGLKVQSFLSQPNGTTSDFSSAQ